MFSDIGVFAKQSAAFDEYFRSYATKKSNLLNIYAQFVKYQQDWDTTHYFGGGPIYSIYIVIFRRKHKFKLIFYEILG